MLDLSDWIFSIDSLQQDLEVLFEELQTALKELNGYIEEKTPGASDPVKERLSKLSNIKSYNIAPIIPKIRESILNLKEAVLKTEEAKLIE